jgi:capsular polysaccharide biosynthesis protein
VEIDEVAVRLVRQYWVLLLFCVIAPVVTVGLVVARQPAVYAADARLITSSQIPASSAMASAIVSQVQGIATGRSAAAQALKAAGARRNLTDFIARDITASGLGSSQVVDLTVTDRSPQVARNVAASLAAEVTHSLNSVGQGGLSAALKAIDQEIVRLSQSRAGLAAQVSASPQNQQLQAKLAGVDQVIANFTGDRGRLLIQASTQGLATVLDEPVLPVKPESMALAQKLGLAGLLGLVAGILLASIAEVARPTVPGARRVSRRLNVPALGALTSDEVSGEQTQALDSVALRIQLAAQHAGVSAIALVEVDGGRQLDDLAGRLERSMVGAVADSTADPAGGLAPSRNGIAGAAGAAGDPAAAVLVQDRRSFAENTAVRVFPLAQGNRPAETSRAGIVVLSGPVARVSAIAALEDLSASSGWPIVGVVGLPRQRRWLAGRDAEGAGR